MKKRNLKISVLSTSLFLLIFPIVGMCSEDALKIEMRVRPEGEAFRLICRATNISEQSETVDRELIRGSNIFKLSFLYDSNRAWGVIGPPGGLSPDVVVLAPGMKKVWKMSDAKFQSLHYYSTIDIYDTSLNKKAGSYILLKWNLNFISSQKPILLGFVDSGDIRKPLVNTQSSSAEYLLGFVYDENNPLELAFLVMNGKDDLVSIEKPLTRNSRIIATSPAIDYTRELVIPDMAVERVVVEAGQVGEWRLPWQTVLNLIPEEDLERIMAAGGDLDLVWRVGDDQSDPLPLSLAELPSVPE